jgi:hypothetical protein
MAPDGEGARCPACDDVNAQAVNCPLFVVTGASGSGKTTIFPEEARPRWRARDIDQQTAFGHPAT